MLYYDCSFRKIDVEQNAQGEIYLNILLTPKASGERGIFSN